MLAANPDIYIGRLDDLFGSTNSDISNLTRAPDEIFGDYVCVNQDATRLIMEPRDIMENKIREWWEDLHIRHTIRICASGLLLLVGVGDILLNIFGAGYWDMFSDLIWVIGSLGILGASTYMAIDMNGE